MVFLTPTAASPDDQHYVAYSYAELAITIETLTTDIKNADAGIAVRHYVEMLRRHIVPDEQLNELALRLYEKHKAAFDFVFANRPRPTSLLTIARGLLETTPGIVSDIDSATILRFVPKEWAEMPQLKCCPADSWTKTGRHLIFEIKTYNSEKPSSRVNLALIIGPSTRPNLRTQLYQGAKDRKFVGIVNPMGATWARIFNKELLSEKSAQGKDLEEKRIAISESWAAFVENDLARLTKDVVDIVKVPHLASEQ